jgi:hypothetical protein
MFMTRYIDERYDLVRVLRGALEVRGTGGENF